MIFCLHLLVTYDNYRRYFSGCGFNYSNLCVYSKTQIKEKDNRPAFNQCGYLYRILGATVIGVPFYNYINTTLGFCQEFFYFLRYFAHTG